MLVLLNAIKHQILFFFIYLIFSTLHHHIYCISINLIKNKVYENSFLIMNMKES